MPLDTRSVLSGPWRRIVDGLFAVSLALALVVGAAGVSQGDGFGPLPNTALAVVAGAAYLLLRRSPNRSWALVVVAACGLVMTALPLPAQSLLLTLTIVALLVVVRGLRAGALYLGALVVALAVVSFTAYPVGLVETLYSVITYAMLHTVGLLLGLLVRRASETGTEARRLNRDLSAANLRLRAALVDQGELVLAEERARQARELHDGIGHRLTLVAMSLQFAERVRDKDPQRAWEEVRRAAETNSATLEELRRWVRALNPPPLDPWLQGADQFEAIAEPFRAAGLEVTVHHEGADEPLPEPVSLYATRFVQEGLTNVLKHAHAATHADLAMVRGAGEVRLTLRDDGDRSAAAGPEGFGLRSLRERATLLGGTLQVGTMPGGGYELVAVLPVAPAEAPEGGR